MTDERRVAQRHRVHAPVRFGTAIGSTRDISLSGVFFETAEHASLGQPVSFSILFPHKHDMGISLDCRGRIVRVDDLGRMAGVAATIDSMEVRTQ